jgi:hypothetical protein
MPDSGSSDNTLAGHVPSASSQLTVVDDNGHSDQLHNIADFDADNPPPRYVNSVDSTTGQPIVVRVMVRKHELETALADLPHEDRRARSDLELALSTIDGLLTGNLAEVPAMVVVDMSRWLERTKHLAESAIPVADRTTTEPSG